jgi:hypothetical protein
MKRTDLLDILRAVSHIKATDKHYITFNYSTNKYLSEIVTLYMHTHEDGVSTECIASDDVHDYKEAEQVLARYREIMKGDIENETD